MTLTTAKLSKPSWKNIISSLNPFDWFCAFLGLLALGYYGTISPFVLCMIVLFSTMLVPFLGIPSFVKKESSSGVVKNELGIVKKASFTIPRSNIQISITFWHILAIVLAAVILLDHSPAHAFFLNHLRDKMAQAVCAAVTGGGGFSGGTGTGTGTGTGGTCQQAGFVNNTFLMIQILVGLGVAGSFIAGLVQAGQQQDPSGMFRLTAIIVIVVVLIEGFSRFIVS